MSTYVLQQCALLLLRKSRLATCPNAVTLFHKSLTLSPAHHWQQAIFITTKFWVTCSRSSFFLEQDFPRYFFAEGESSCITNVRFSKMTQSMNTATLVFYHWQASFYYDPLSNLWFTWRSFWITGVWINTKSWYNLFSLLFLDLFRLIVSFAFKNFIFSRTCGRFPRRYSFLRMSFWCAHVCFMV